LKNHFDAILLDLAMPGFSGFSVLEELDKNKMIKLTNIIVLTATPITHNMEILLKGYGIKEILKKPADIQNLINTIGNYA